jgi:hypothetical protein
MVTLRLVLDTLKNYFVDNRVIESKSIEAVITDGKVTAADINETFPINCYFMLEGTIFNREIYKVTGVGTDYIEAADIIADPSTDVCIKACLIPKPVLDFYTEYSTKGMPMFKSEKIGSYSYSTDKEGVEGFIINSLKPYYNGVII